MLEVCFGGVNTHWKHRWYQNALHCQPKESDSHTPNQPSLRGGGWDFSTFLYIFIFCTRWGFQPSCNPLFFLTLVMGGIIFHTPKAQLGPYFGGPFCSGFTRVFCNAFWPLPKRWYRRHVLRCKDPSVKNVEMAMESFGDELGAAGEVKTCWGWLVVQIPLPSRSLI